LPGRDGPGRAPAKYCAATEAVIKTIAVLPFLMPAHLRGTMADRDLTTAAAVDAAAPGRGLVAQLWPLLKLLRPQQWLKNAFVIAPLFFTPAAATIHNAVLVLLGVLCFCALSSTVYIVNDYADRDSDRAHPVKCRRPLAAGTVSLALAASALGLLLAVGLAGGFALNPAFGWIALAYLLCNFAYSFGLKTIAILDVMLIAFGFLLRVEAGSVLIAARPSAWILVCTGLLALFLAMAKRRDDLERDLDAAHRASLRGYTREFLDTSVTVLLGALLIAYLIYTTDAQVTQRLGTDQLYFTAPFVVAGILRYLQVTLVEKRSGSPTEIVVADPFMILAITGWLATFGALIYL
jgi:decaprenyl-phosphate phosphoribosyltransferase